MGRSGRFQVALVLATGALALVAPSVAAAADWYVSNAGSDAHTCNSPTAADACLTVQHVAGAVAGSGDTIHIGPGIFTEGVSAATKQLAFIGAGAGAPDGFNSSSDTLIRAQSNDVALRMQGGGTVRGLRLEGGSSPPAPDNQPRSCSRPSVRADRCSTRCRT